ncbi:MAG: TonB family protein [Gemmatimonadota bacterium]
MYLTLPESSARSQRGPGGTVLSAVVHAAVIGATVVGTGISAPRETTPLPLEKLVFVVPPPEVLPTHTATLPSVPPPPQSTVTPPLVPPVVAPLPDLAIVPTSVPASVPTSLPDVDMRLAGMPEAGPVTQGVGSGGTPKGGLLASIGGAPMTALTVDREVMVRVGAAPRYPAMLASAGIEGLVLARFVVDTLGHVERGSIELASNSHAMFAQSVRDALGRMRFVPAESHGRKVRQLVQQPFTFEITPR